MKEWNKSKVIWRESAEEKGKRDLNDKKKCECKSVSIVWGERKKAKQEKQRNAEIF